MTQFKGRKGKPAGGRGAIKASIQAFARANTSVYSSLNQTIA